MTGIIRKFKYFFAWQHEEHEHWLEEQARQGRHLVRLNGAGMHWFNLGEPAKAAYRWDVAPACDRETYIQLFQDAGWDLAAATQGWYCWRKVGVASARMEIFTDNASRQRKYMQLVWPLGVALVANIPLAWLNPGFWAALFGHDTQVGPAARLFLGAILTASVLCAVGLALVLKRIRHLQAPV